MAYDDTSTLYGDVVTLGGVVFDPRAATIDRALQMVDVMAGWDGSPPIRARANDRPNRHGAYRNTRTFFSQRELVVEGAIVADTRTAYLTARARMMRSVSVTDKLSLSRTDALFGLLAMDVYLNGQIEFTGEIDNGCRFSIPLIAPDPTKLSTRAYRSVVNMQIPQDYVRTYTVSGSDRVRTYTASGSDRVRTYTRVGEFTPGAGYLESDTLINRGNADAWPISYVTGPLKRGWYIENVSTPDGGVPTTERLIFDFELLPNQVAVIDHKERTAVLNNGQDTHIEATARGSWWAVRPGSNTYRLSQALYNSTANLQMLTSETAWI